MHTFTTSKKQNKKCQATPRSFHFRNFFASIKTISLLHLLGASRPSLPSVFFYKSVVPVVVVVAPEIIPTASNRKPSTSSESKGKKTVPFSGCVFAKLGGRRTISPTSTQVGTHVRRCPRFGAASLLAYLVVPSCYAFLEFSLALPSITPSSFENESCDLCLAAALSCVLSPIRFDSKLGGWGGTTTFAY